MAGGLQLLAKSEAVKHAGILPASGQEGGEMYAGVGEGGGRDSKQCKE